MESLEETHARHRKEAKDLAGQITALKKTVAKGAGDKKKKKDVQDQINVMEAELKARHEQEMAQATSSSSKTPDEDATKADVDEVETTEEPATHKKKPNRQHQRKARKAAEMEEQRKLAEEEAANAPKMREVEMDAISNASRPLGLSLRELASSVRKIAADYLRKHAETFLPFVAGELDKDITEGQIELRALSQALRRSIHVFQMNTPVIKIGEEYSGIPLTISYVNGSILCLSSFRYHRHYYGLGEHYNSL
ncbi:hypothetical protein BC829DRAFT_382587, partial [Chytridium lagenaria]